MMSALVPKTDITRSVEDRGPHQRGEFRSAGFDEFAAFFRRQITDPRHIDLAKRFDAPPSIIAGNLAFVTGFHAPPQRWWIGPSWVQTKAPLRGRKETDRCQRAGNSRYRKTQVLKSKALTMLHAEWDLEKPRKLSGGS